MQGQTTPPRPGRIPPSSSGLPRSCDCAEFAHRAQDRPLWGDHIGTQWIRRMTVRYGAGEEALLTAARASKLGKRAHGEKVEKKGGGQCTTVHTVTSRLESRRSSFSIFPLSSIDLPAHCSMQRLAHRCFVNYIPVRTGAGGNCLFSRHLDRRRGLELRKETDASCAPRSK